MHELAFRRVWSYVFLFYENASVATVQCLISQESQKASYVISGVASKDAPITCNYL